MSGVHGHCDDCGKVIVYVWDDGEVIWVECGECARTIIGFARDYCPSSLLWAAEKIDD